MTDQFLAWETNTQGLFVFSQFFIDKILFLFNHLHFSHLLKPFLLCFYLKKKIIETGICLGSQDMIVLNQLGHWIKESCGQCHADYF